MASKLYSDPGCLYVGCSPPPPPPRPPPSPPSPPSPLPPSKSIPLIAILLFCALGTAFFVVSYLTYIRKHYTNSNNSRRRNRDPPIDEQDFVDLNDGPVLDHPIWYIRTIGLQQSVIDSISVFKYKRDEGLIEGTDCSVCLSEFQEDETLRLLPKCSHAFHIPCIDTWLRSHKNCPLCRAPIVSENARVSAPEPNLSPLGTGEEIRVENSESHDGLGSDQVGGGGNVEMGVENGNSGGLASEEGRIADISRKNSRGFNSKSCEIRVPSDLADLQTRGEEELQPMRRSVSMDSLSASRIYLAVANIPRVELEGSSSTRAVQVKKPNPDKVLKGVRRNLSISRLMKSSSTSFSLQNLPVAMKRSVSSSGKFTSPRRYSKSQDSILPV